jgi:hypothetical protein
MVRDGLLPLEVWFGYGLSFLMTAVFAYLGLLIWATLRHERQGQGLDRAQAQRAAAVDAPHLTGAVTRSSAARRRRTERVLTLLGVAGLVASLTAIGLWLLLRYPGPAAVPGTIGSLVLAAMILGVVVVATVVARGAER